MAPRNDGVAEPGEGEGSRFEESLQRLEAIVQELESGRLTLEESLARYEEGMKLTRHLSRTLDEAEKRIERLTQEGGSLRTVPLEPELEKGPPEQRAQDGELPF